MIDKTKLRKRIMRRLRKMRIELRETISLKEQWNSDHDEQPFDVGFERVLCNYADLALKAWEANDISEASKWTERMGEMGVASVEERIAETTWLLDPEA